MIGIDIVPDGAADRSAGLSLRNPVATQIRQLTETAARIEFHDLGAGGARHLHLAGLFQIHGEVEPGPGVGGLRIAAACHSQRQPSPCCPNVNRRNNGFRPDVPRVPL